MSEMNDTALGAVAKALHEDMCVQDIRGYLDAKIDCARLAPIAIAAYIQSSGLGSAGGVEVKALEWVQKEISPCLWSAQTSFVSCYSVWEQSEEDWRCSLLDDRFRSLDDAKNAAQADYEQRIHSALVATPKPEATEGGAHERATPEMIYAAHEAFELTGHFSTYSAMEKAINAALTTPEQTVEPTEGGEA